MRSLFILLCGLAIANAEPTLRPIDESAFDPTLSKFMKELTAAIEQRDAHFVEHNLTSDALASFGEERGLNGFTRTYGLADPRAPFWGEFQNVLSLGGAFTEGRKEFIAPYVAARWPDKFDAMEYVALIAKNVVVHAAADPTSKSVARLSYSLLQIKSEGDGSGQADWVAVLLPAGGTGFVPTASVRSPLDYRAQFRREGGAWKLASFLAGD
ncbi:MAG: hypothetical protein M3Y03_04660 [Verrucomicrobiota bacterium]|nr:hypothetical protein [Verrucomicrobiota bacterium]